MDLLAAIVMCVGGGVATKASVGGERRVLTV